MVRIWGAKTYDDVLMVDQQGNVFLPEVGRPGGRTEAGAASGSRPVKPCLRLHRQRQYLRQSSKLSTRSRLRGGLREPSRKIRGWPMDSVMSYLDRAGGITPERGSYRHIKVMRGKSLIGTVDLYDFALRGEMPSIRLKDGDVILVDERGSSVAALGLLRQQAVMNSWARRPGRTFSISLRR